MTLFLILSLRRVRRVVSPLSLYSLSIAGTALALVSFSLWRNRHSSRLALQKWSEAKQSGLVEPASLHPLIDPNVCLGCGTCVTACPEGAVLGLVNRKAQLVAPASCIGHGACREACPTGAISLVFGSATRGVEIPMLSPNFESSVPGLFIAGELGGMGLIKNAITQGQQAAEAAARARKSRSGDYDLVIVGAGPAGLSAALAAQRNKLRYVVLEQDTVGGTIAHYPRGKVVMTAPAALPVVGKFQFREASKEKLVEFWQSVVDRSGLEIHTGQRVSDIRQTGKGFTVETEQGMSLEAKTVLLAMGRRGTPRKLGVEGEQLPKVVYRMIDPEQYAGRRVLVVGGGDSALEAALAIAEQPGSTVTLSYRSDAFSRAKTKNRDRVAAAEQAGVIRVMLQSNITSIGDAAVDISTAGGTETLPNDDVIVCAGGILPTPFLKQIGIHVEEKFGTV